ncbi:MAG: HlyD family efflux transporter periplasmic adaptor subunit [Bacillota bacterium]
MAGQTKKSAGRKASKPRSSRRRRRSETERSKLVLFALVALVLLISFPWIRRVVASQLIRMTPAEQGVIELIAPGDGLLVRSETVVTTPIAGTVTLLQEEGARVRVGTPIAQVTNGEARGQAEDQEREAEQRLSDFKTANAPELADLQAKLRDSDGRLDVTLAELQRAAFNRDLKALDAATAASRQLSQARADTASRLDGLAKQQAALEGEVAAAKALVDKATAELTAPAAGIISFRRDGLENVFSPSTLSELTGKKALAELAQASSTKGGDALRPGQAVFKVIDSVRAYVAVVLPGDQLPAVDGKKMVTLRFPELKGQAVAATVERVGEKERNGYGLAVFSTDQFLTEFADLRRTPVQVVKESYAGVIVPRGALAQREGREGVFILRKSQVIFKPVTVVGFDRRRVAIDGIDPGAQVVTNPWLVIGTEQQIQ